MHCRRLLGRALLSARKLLPPGRLEYNTGPDGVVKSPWGTLEIPRQTLHECMFEGINSFAEKTALECSVTGRSYSYGRLRKMAHTLAASFQNKLKLEKGDVVAAYLPNLPEYPLLFLAGSETGVIVTTINSSYLQDEVSRQLLASNTKVVFTTVALYSLVESALKIARKSLPVIVIKENEDSAIPDGAVNMDEMLDPNTSGTLRRVDVSPDDVAVLPYSSGTTGLPKGVELTHRNIVANALQMSDAVERLGNNDPNRNISLALLPMFHIYGMSGVTFTGLRMGGTIITTPKFEPLHFLETIKGKKITTLYLVPPLILFLSNNHFVKPEMLKSVRYLINGASPIGHKDLEKFQEKGKQILIGQGYGMTETSPVVLLVRKETAHKYGSVGCPILATEVKIVDPETLEPRPENQVGEIWVRGPQVMKGYLNNRKATEDMIQDGWLRTGDLAYFDEDGDFFVVDRLKDLIKVKGFQVAPAELEELLRSHPKVVDAAVVGVPHEKKGEVPKAFVVLRSGSTASEAEIKEFVRGKVAEYKELDGGVVFLEAIPKSAAGKILKRELK